MTEEQIKLLCKLAIENSRKQLTKQLIQYLKSLLHFRRLKTPVMNC